MPVDPAKDAFDFEGWYKDEQFNQPYTNDAVIKSDLSLYAKLVASPLKYTYDSASGYYMLTGIWDKESTSVIVPDTYKKKKLRGIKSGALAGCNKLAEITTPFTRTIEDKLFASIFGDTFPVALNVINISGNTVSYSAFEDSSFDGTVNIASSVLTINEDSFKNSRVTDINFAENSGLKTIKASAFRGSSISEIQIPESATDLETFLFQDCSKLSSVILPDTITKIGQGMFKNCVALESFTFPTGIKRIYYNAFENSGLKGRLNIPKSVTSIYMQAFINCDKLQSVYIPNTVESIDMGAFASCDLLTDIYCQAASASSLDFKPTWSGDAKVTWSYSGI